MQKQRMGSTPILYINVNITIDTMLKFDTNTDAKIKLTLSVNGPVRFLFMVRKGFHYKTKYLHAI